MWKIVMVALLITSCSDWTENKIDLKSIQIEENPRGDTLVIKSGGNIILEESRSFSKPKDLFYDAFIEPTAGLPNNSPSINEAYFLMNFAKISKTNTDSADMLLVNLLLRKIKVDKLLNFHTDEGEMLAKIILEIKFGDIKRQQDLGYRIFTNPVMSYTAQVDSAFKNDLLKESISEYKNGKVTENQLLDNIHDITIIDQFDQMVARNGTILMIARSVTHNLKNMTQFSEISLCYQYLDNGILQIGEVYLNPYRNTPYVFYE